jgi:UDP-GlcNAc:undecaprenyl-phosphate GlcNAc-1-phosphate transferase
VPFLLVRPLGRPDAMTLATLLPHFAFGLVLFALSTTLTWLASRHLRVMDVPNQRSSHSAPTPKTGGVAIVSTFLAGMVAIHFAADVARIEDRYFWGFLACVLLLAVVSFADDVNQRSYAAKLTAQALCGLAVVLAGFTIERLWIPLAGETALGWLAYPVTLLWVIGLTNTCNFMDGLDGLTAGVAAIAGVFLCGIALSQDSVFVYAASYALVAAALGFLVFNFPPARIFMGDAGSTFFGFAFAVLALIGAHFDLGHLSFYVVPMLLFQFIFDTLFTFLRRLARGEPVHQAHRTHLYQLLQRSGYSHRAVTLFHYAVAVAQGIGAVAIVKVEPQFRVLVFLPFLAFNVCYAAWVLRRCPAAA